MFAFESIQMIILNLNLSSKETRAAFIVVNQSTRDQCMQEARSVNDNGNAMSSQNPTQAVIPNGGPIPAAGPPVNMLHYASPSQVQHGYFAPGTDPVYGNNLMVASSHGQMNGSSMSRANSGMSSHSGYGLPLPPVQAPPQHHAAAPHPGYMQGGVPGHMGPQNVVANPSAPQSHLGDSMMGSIDGAGGSQVGGFPDAPSQMGGGSGNNMNAMSPFDARRGLEAGAVGMSSIPESQGLYHEAPTFGIPNRPVAPSPAPSSVRSTDNQSQASKNPTAVTPQGVLSKDGGSGIPSMPTYDSVGGAHG
jgi:hypothetical protein